MQDDFNNNRIFDVETDLMNNNINLTKEIFMNREFAETWLQTLKTMWLTGGAKARPLHPSLQSNKPRKACKLHLDVK